MNHKELVARKTTRSKNFEVTRTDQLCCLNDYFVNYDSDAQTEKRLSKVLRNLFMFYSKLKIELILATFSCFTLENIARLVVQTSFLNDALPVPVYKEILLLKVKSLIRKITSCKAIVVK